MFGICLGFVNLFAVSKTFCADHALSDLSNHHLSTCKIGFCALSLLAATNTLPLELLKLGLRGLTVHPGGERDEAAAAPLPLTEGGIKQLEECIRIGLGRTPEPPEPALWDWAAEGVPGKMTSS